MWSKKRLPGVEARTRAAVRCTFITRPLTLCYFQGESDNSRFSACLVAQRGFWASVWSPDQVTLDSAHAFEARAHHTVSSLTRCPHDAGPAFSPLLHANRLAN